MNDVPLIFLDVDGVLNSEQMYRDDMERAGDVFPWNTIGKAYVDHLNRLTNNTGACIVISASLRIGRTLEVLQNAFKRMGVTGTIVGKTPHDNPDACRGDEIKQWLSEIDALDANYVILDDDSDMLPEQMDRLVKTNNAIGLTDLQVYLAEAKLMTRLANERARLARIDLSMAVIQALFMYWYNTPHLDIAEAVYNKPADAYVQEKLAIMRTGIHNFWGQIDYQHQLRLVNAAMAKYGAEAGNQMRLRSGA